MTPTRGRQWLDVPCVVCQNPAAQRSRGTSVFAAHCRTCGHYLLTKEALKYLHRRRGDFLVARTILSSAAALEDAKNRRFTIDVPTIQRAVARAERDSLVEGTSD